MKSPDNQQAGSTRGFASIDADQKRNLSSKRDPNAPFYEANENEKELSKNGSRATHHGEAEKTMSSSVERISPDQDGHGEIIPGTVEDSNSEEAVKYLQNKVKKDQQPTKRS